MEILRFVFEEHPFLTIAFIVIIGAVIERIVSAWRAPRCED